MKSRRHHNNTALTSTKRVKCKKEVVRIADKLCIPLYGCRCCECQGIRCLINHPGHSHRMKDDIPVRPDDDPGYGWGI